MDRYSTHLNLLKDLYSRFSPKTVLEFGLGEYSTPFFIQGSDKVVSIEMQQDTWYYGIYELYKHHENWEPVLNIGCDFESAVPDTYFDLVFVDGHGDCRPECINYMFNRASIIVTHDYEAETYGWDRINVPSGYTFEIDNSIIPYTACWIKTDLL